MHLLLSVSALVIYLTDCCASIVPRSGKPAYEYFGSAQHQLKTQQGGSPVRSWEDISTEERANAVRDAFTFAFDGYWEYCKGQDELLPVSNGCGNSRNNWGASAIDALSTALIMEIQPIVTEILEYVPTVDFTTTATGVSLFETTIRYLAGMLSAYDLLQGPLSHLSPSESAVESLLAQSKVLADSLKFAFETPTGIPANNLFFATHSTDGSTSNGLATIGSLQLEWQRLSDLTGDPTYGSLAQKAESYLLHPEPNWAEPFPGLVGTRVNIDTGEFLDATGGWNGGDDSFYEYLLKMYVYDSSRFGNYSDRWTVAANSAMQHLASHPSSQPQLTFLASFVNTSFVNASQHLTCFDGGSFLLGGQVFGKQEYIDFGLALVEGCHDLYDSTATKIGPEQFSWDTSAVPPDQVDFYDRAGYWIINPVYVLRPEVIESFYYAFRITGDEKYQEWAWDAFVAINATTRVGSGFSSISDVTVPGGGSFSNEQESFFFAEVLKYVYLIHAPDEVWNVNFNGTNQWVFNTEAHPLKVVGPPV